MDLNLLVGILEKNAICTLSYRKQKDPHFITWGTVTSDLSGNYIQSRLPKNMRKLKANEILLWNWRYDSPLVVDAEQVTAIRPLSLARPDPL